MQVPVTPPHFQSYAHKSGTDVALNNISKEAIATKQNRIEPAIASVNNAFMTENETLALQQTANLSEKLQAAPEWDNEKMSKLLDEVLSSINKDLSFSIDEESGRSVVTIFQATTGEVIRQIPDEEMLVVLRRLAARSSGLLEDKV